MTIKAVCWDVDRVWYPDISTSYCAAQSTLDPHPYLQDFLSRGWFTEDHVQIWQKNYNSGKQIDSVDGLARFLTDALYKMKPAGEIYKEITDQEAKQRTIEGKQALLRGMTIRQVKEIADSVPLTEGLPDCTYDINQNGIHQVAFSDGLGPFVAHKMTCMGIPIGGIVPAILIYHGQETEFNKDNAKDLLYPRALYDAHEDARLTGKTKSFSKAKAFKEYAEANGYPLDSCALIDDSAANIDGMMLPVAKAGGIAIAFRPNDRKKFKEAGIPILKGEDLRAFAEVVLGRSQIPEYCE